MSDDKTIIADPAGITAFNAPKKVSACLVQYSGANLGKRFILDQNQIIIGRSPNSSIVVNEKSVSRQHAQLAVKNDNIEIEDMGSSNGSFVNDQKIEEKKVLKDGDIIRLGTILFKFFSQSNIDNLFHDKIYRMATIDGGTQTFNKKYLLETLDSEFKFSRTYGRPLSIIYFDLDFFKKVNDTYGHNAGDHILQETANLVKSCVRKDDTLARFGGEEFVILLPNTGAKFAYDLAERIRQRVEDNEFVFEGKTIEQKISAGVSQLNDDFKTPADFLESADQKLYKSKTTGRNKVTI